MLELHDIIKIKKIQKKKDIIIINGPFKNFINKHKNSITETLAVLRQKKMLEKNLKYEVNIYKNIPVFSGLGGSASNAAYILKYLVLVVKTEGFLDIYFTEKKLDMLLPKKARI